MITNNKDHDNTIKKVRKLQIHLTKENDTSQTMISSFGRFGAYLEVNSSPPTGDPMSDQVERLELQVKNLLVPTQKYVQNIPDIPPVQSSLCDLPMDITMTTAPIPAPKLKTYKSAVQNQTIKTTQPKSNQNQTVAITVSPQQQQQQQQQQKQRSQ